MILDIDLIELLKDCPEGTKIYSRAFGTVSFNCIKSDRISIKDCKGLEIHYAKSGKFYYAEEDAEIDLFPSKDQRDWSKWQRPFKDGDIVYLDFGHYYIITIFKRQYGEFLYHHASLRDNNVLSINTDNSNICTSYLKEIRFAAEEEKTELFQVIKDNGYKWNAEEKKIGEVN